MLYADVIIDISHEAVDRSFQYKVGEDLAPRIHEGSLLKVPFGRGDNLKKAYCIGLSNEAKIPEEKLKYVHSLEEGDVSIEGQLIALAMWMADTYGSTKAAALRTVLPAAKKAGMRKSMSVSLPIDPGPVRAYLAMNAARKNKSVARERLLTALINDGTLPWEVITKKLGVDSAVIRDLEKKGLLCVDSKEGHFEPKKSGAFKGEELILNEEQKACLDTFVSDNKSGARGVYLLHGITGSGKTEVYIRMIEEVIGEGKSAIVLIPEIALTYQTLMRFYHRFGDMVSIMNSQLSPSEKYDIANRAKSGKIRIILGPRSALFTPFKDLGLIIIDEEHETSYKSEKSPRYHARECAIKRASLAGASVVLGSATPSMESYYRACRGEYKLLTLKKRAASSSLATCEVVDLREELKSGNRSILSRRLKVLIEENLANKKQTMLFINRRGMLAGVSCRACGEVIKCPHCDVALSLHGDGRLHCHYCGYHVPAPKTCPNCNSGFIGGFKAGTEKIEAQIKKMFPTAGVLRMDADSTKGKDGHEKILSRFANREADILVGTQMIVKGHDFPDVSLVGILAADMSLNFNDFRSAERTFDLITQAAGRAGRAGVPGRVVIQTYKPDHYAVVASASQDYEGFYKQEIAYRKMMKYPPVSHLLLVMLLGRFEKEVEDLSEKLSGHLESAHPGVWISKAVKPGISKLQDIHRRMIYLKNNDEKAIFAIRREIDELVAGMDTNVSIYYDFDPMGFF